MHPRLAPRALRPAPRLNRLLLSLSTPLLPLLGFAFCPPCQPAGNPVVIPRFRPRSASIEIGPWPRAPVAAFSPSDHRANHRCQLPSDNTSDAVTVDSGPSVLRTSNGMSSAAAAAGRWVCRCLMAAAQHDFSPPAAASCLPGPRSRMHPRGVFSQLAAPSCRCARCPVSVVQARTLTRWQRPMHHGNMSIPGALSSQHSHPHPHVALHRQVRGRQPNANASSEPRPQGLKASRSQEGFPRAFSASASASVQNPAPVPGPSGTPPRRTEVRTITHPACSRMPPCRAFLKTHVPTRALQDSQMTYSEPTPPPVPDRFDCAAPKVGVCRPFPPRVRRPACGAHRRASSAALSTESHLSLNRRRLPWHSHPHCTHCAGRHV
ncbi:hypothetical protein L226DRAFT_312694 [Lentinus tigrinus ALCF2SS1-7]|uniref:Ig-like domain-containing protein n=1 Tax=Lentinus tigrinus ALCF2SS1-6 TaxID=1328759 RepID=A0A5C2RRE1_9APHY|nr:hypothetical protein L227DRAFT_370778 [Lentinus tigrinus ALCF2SS1-6]RPD68896.1 hypothetical protein L226DRAFT_312694 [Lentinus tigrinus ALCF2SS1-7]